MRLGPSARIAGCLTATTQGQVTVRMLSNFCSGPLRGQVRGCLKFEQVCVADAEGHELLVTAGLDNLAGF
jgi:hypothetical protein